MKFTIYAAFKDQDNKIVEEKEEATYDWPQAFGTFAVYIGHPDCVQCMVTYKDSRNLTHCALSYNEIIE